MEEPGVCGARILVDFNKSETFYLYANVGDYETYYGSIQIDVANDQDYITQPVNKNKYLYYISTHH